MSIESRVPLDTFVVKFINGWPIRPGFYRLNTGGAAAKYATAVATGSLDKDCVFCPPLHQKNVIEGAPDGFAAFEASAPYQYWDNQEVEKHLMITPEAHVNRLHSLGGRAIRRLYDFIGDLQQQQRGRGITVQPYTRDPENYSKSVDHLHTHAFFLTGRRVEQLRYDIDTGLTVLSFRSPRPEEVPIPRDHWDAQELVDEQVLDISQITPERNLGTAGLVLYIENEIQKLRRDISPGVVLQPYVQVDSNGETVDARIFSINPNPVARVEQDGDNVRIDIATLTPDQMRKLEASRAA